jgi:hypothetical protein
MKVKKETARPEATSPRRNGQRDEERDHTVSPCTVINGPDIKHPRGSEHPYQFSTCTSCNAPAHINI